MPRKASETLLRLNDRTILSLLESKPSQRSWFCSGAHLSPRHFPGGMDGEGPPSVWTAIHTAWGPQCEEPAPGPPRDVGTRQGHQATGPQAARVHGVSRFWDEVSTSPSPPSRDWLLAKSPRKGPCPASGISSPTTPRDGPSRGASSREGFRAQGTPQGPSEIGCKPRR